AENHPPLLDGRGGQEVPLVGPLAAGFWGSFIRIRRVLASRRGKRRDRRLRAWNGVAGQNRRFLQRPGLRSLPSGGDLGRDRRLALCRLRPPDPGTGRVAGRTSYLLAETGFERSLSERTRSLSEKQVKADKDLRRSAEE